MEQTRHDAMANQFNTGVFANKDYFFTNEWFSQNIQNVWSVLIPLCRPSRVLEMGSFEGRSTCWLIEKFGKERNMEIHCVDSWEGCNDNAHFKIDFKSVENRFHHNVKTALSSKDSNTIIDVKVHKGLTEDVLPRLLSNKTKTSGPLSHEGNFKNFFDFIYVDASHLTADCLFDAVVSFKMLRSGGIMCFDDYLFKVPHRPQYDSPKTAVDAFVNLNLDRLLTLPATTEQFFIMKIKGSESVPKPGGDN